MLFLFAFAHAEAAFVADSAPCSAGAASFSSPMPGATGVPTDIAPAVVIDDLGCGNFGEWTLTLSPAANDSVVQAATVSAESGLAELLLDEPLLGNTDYVLIVAPQDMSAGTTEIAFSTGAGRSEADAPIPSLTDLAPLFDSEVQEVQLSAVVKLGNAAGADRIVQVLDAARDPFVESSVHTNLGASGTTFTDHWVSRTMRVNAPGEWCAAARVRNLDGSWAEGDPECAEVELVSPAGLSCNSGAHAPAALAAGLAGALIARRRRSPPRR